MEENLQNTDGAADINALYRVAALSSAAGDDAYLARGVAEVIADALEARGAFVGLCRDDGGLALYSTVSLPDELPMSAAGPLARVVINQSPELLNDVPGDPDAALMHDSLRSIRQLLAAPLVAGDKVLGIAAAVDPVRGAFTRTDLRTLGLLSERTALAIENAQLTTALGRQTQELEGLQRLSRLLTSTDSLERVLGEAIRIVMDLLECERIAVLLYDEATDSLVAHKPVIGMTEEQVEGLKIPMTEPSLGGTVYRTNTPLFSNDAVRDQWVSRRFQALLEIETLAVVPLSSSGRPIGILKVVNAKKGFFDEEDLGFLALIGRQVGAVVDATIAREREQALMRRLREADRSKTEFVSMLAHELRSPMTTVVGYGNLLRDQWELLAEEKRKEMVEVVARETERLATLLNDLLDVSRLDGGALRFDPEPTDLADVLHNILEVHASSLGEAHAIEHAIPDNLPKVMADKDRIRQVVINLLTNAVRYSPEGTIVRVWAEPYDSGERPAVRVAVKDQGIGIAPEDVDRIFTKFAMLPKPSWTRKGTGLGLYITKGIVDAHGGRLWVESERGRGSTFNFTVPLADDAG